MTFAYHRKHDEAYIKEYDVLKLDVENLNMN